jgi:glycerol-3-phosphate dehydrogenase
MLTYNSLQRKELIEKILSTEYDLAVIGGGITGAGIALDAVSRGLKIVLVEKNDFASGTSSRSTKLIHGGLRYLKQLEFGLVIGVGRERRIVHDLAPHLVVSEKMLLPFFKKGTFGKFSTSLGLWVYDLLAGVRKEDRRKMLSKNQTLEMEPLLPGETLKGSGLYAEYRTDDARLTIEVIKTAVSLGADCLSYAEVMDFIYADNKISGIRILDHLSGQEYELFSKVVVSATGPWVDHLRDKNHSKEGKTLHLTKGVHIVVPHEKMPVRHSVYFDVPDGRMIFAIPRGSTTYVGTTDTDYFGNKDLVMTTREDAGYLVNAVNHSFPSVQLRVEDIISSWAGLRPLINQPGKKTSEISRKDEIFISDSALISIAGGKLTGYRKMSLKIVNLVSEILRNEYNLSPGNCKTRSLKLTGNDFTGSKQVKKYIEEINETLRRNGLGLPDANYLVHNYGRQTNEILEIMDTIDEKDTDLRLLLAELRFCILHELIVSASDFLVRRTGRLFFRIESVKKYAEPILLAMSKSFQWSQNRLSDERKRMELEIFEAANFE